MAKGFTISEKSIEYLRLLPKEDAGELLHALIDTYLTGEKQDYQGTEKHLFFERTSDRFASRFGRWFVESLRPAGR